MTLEQGNIAQAVQQAVQIRQVSQTLGTGVSQLQDLHAQIRGQWYGPASEAFCRELDLLIQQMQETNSKLIETAVSLESVSTMGV